MNTMNLGACSASEFDTWMENLRAGALHSERPEIPEEVVPENPLLKQLRDSRGTDTLEISQYAPPSFWTVPGSVKKTAALKRKGFPRSLKNQKMVTLTINRAKYDSPEDAYRVGSRHMRQFMYELRKKYDIARYLWKLEFHQPDENGDQWPHWHLIIDYKRKIESQHVTDAWGKGRAEVKIIDDEGFDYLTKYVTKSNDEIPEWIGKRVRVRVWQTSIGFYKVNIPDDGTDAIEKILTFEEEIDQIIEQVIKDERKERMEQDRVIMHQLDYSAETIKQRVIRWLSMAQVKVVKENEVIYFSAELNQEWKKTILQVAKTATKAVDFMGQLTTFELQPRKIILPLHSCLQQQQLLQMILKSPCALAAL